MLSCPGVLNPGVLLLLSCQRAVWCVRHGVHLPHLVPSSSFPVLYVGSSQYQVWLYSFRCFSSQIIWAFFMYSIGNMSFPFLLIIPHMFMNVCSIQAL